jgi:ATP-dependent RNA helicase DeaD
VPSFDSLPLRPETRSALAALDIHSPTPIQDAALPPLLAGQDVIGQARTGSGKTLAFALPIVERIDPRRPGVQALVLVPTRELATQVADVVRSAAARRPLRTLLLVGGLSLGPQKAALAAGVQVVVGTPGRVQDHLSQGTLRLGGLRLLVLDEADEMLDRGFGPSVEQIIAMTPPSRQTALFSATMPAWLEGIAAKHMRSPVVARVDRDAQPVAHVDHAVYDVPEGGKQAALRALLDARPPGATLVFGRTKHGVRKLAKQLQAAGYPVAALEGNMSQPARERAIAAFRSGETPILLATNVAARGLDIEHVAWVINYELPETADLLTHRVGRTGRMGRAGEAITLLAPADGDGWRKLSRDLRHSPLRRPWRGRHLQTVAANGTPSPRVQPSRLQVESAVRVETAVRATPTKSATAVRTAAVTASAASSASPLAADETGARRRNRRRRGRRPPAAASR